MAMLPLMWRQELDLFKRQYLQLQLNLKYPEGKYLKHEEFQQMLYSEIFSEDAVKWYPPQRYQLRVLKELMKRVEASITDWEEEVRDPSFSVQSLISDIFAFIYLSLLHELHFPNHMSDLCIRHSRAYLTT
jgi:protein-lysine N-methyltransferase EEF2KMT